MWINSFLPPRKSVCMFLGGVVSKARPMSVRGKRGCCCGICPQMPARFSTQTSLLPGTEHHHALPVPRNKHWDLDTAGLSSCSAAGNVFMTHGEEGAKRWCLWPPSCELLSLTQWQWEQEERCQWVTEDWEVALMVALGKSIGLKSYLDLSLIKYPKS